MSVLEIPDSMKKDLVILVLVPSGESWKAGFGISLTCAVSRLACVQAVPWARSQRVVVESQKSSHLLNLREGLLRSALMNGVDYIVMVDSDMLFPPDALIRLLRRGKDVVGVNYSTKSETDPRFTAVADGRNLMTDHNSTGLVEVEGMGCGLVLIRAECLKTIPEPWFPAPWREETQAFDGEDVSFFRLLREHGVKLYVDQDLSKEVGHEGAYVYKYDTTSEWVKYVERQRESG